MTCHWALPRTRFGCKPVEGRPNPGFQRQHSCCSIHLPNPLQRMAHLVVVFKLKTLVMFLISQLECALFVRLYWTCSLTFPEPSTRGSVTVTPSASCLYCEPSCGVVLALSASDWRGHSLCRERLHLSQSFSWIFSSRWCDPSQCVGAMTGDKVQLYNPRARTCTAT